MERRSEPIQQSPKTFEQLMADNRGAVEQHNAKALSALLFLGWLLVLLPVIAVPFSHTKGDALPAYLPALLIFLVRLCWTSWGTRSGSHCWGCTSRLMCCLSYPST